jgi:hypothetical protein
LFFFEQQTSTLFDQLLTFASQVLVFITELDSRKMLLRSKHKAARQNYSAKEKQSETRKDNSVALTSDP